MKAFEYYADSVYHRNTLIGTKCTSWKDFLKLKCSNNEKVPMGHDAVPRYIYREIISYMPSYFNFN